MVGVLETMSLPKKVLIREVGPREGFQTLSKVLATEQKLELIKKLAGSGVRELEVASFVRPDLVPQMADAEELVRQLPVNDSVRYKALYLNDKGFERAEQFELLKNDAWIYLSASETFLQRNSRISLDTALARLPEWTVLFRKHQKAVHGVMISAAFGCNYEGRIPEEKVYALIDRVLQIFKDLGQPVQELSLADTMGHANPEQVKRMVATLKGKFPELQLSLHLHDTRGSGLANAYAGLQEGIDIFESSVAGIGGCPFAKDAAGNICTEDFAHLCEECGVQTGLDLSVYVEAARIAERLVGGALPGKLYRSGVF